MKCYTFVVGTLVRGIEVMADAKTAGHNVVSLGMLGRGNTHKEVVHLRDRHGPSIKDGKLIEADLLVTTIDRGKREERMFYTLVQSGNHYDVRVLLRLCTKRVKRKLAWSALVGDPVRILHAYGTSDCANSVGLWNDDLVQLVPGDVIRVTDGATEGWIVEYCKSSGRLLVQTKQATLK
jgi:hypothetical protein